ncbi:hypothetical protein A8B82_03580 [Sulfitobacter sp. EhC04]|uniref:hypothetical protein n=1 Tax=Sulfitobacter sp. EhC04 TaxID=1849168 RepID=UPI0007F466E5|nr:hypothetical protein [Sulfitobacter sp. EhC04]OAN71393.1 hypothetical protein A8B82_03580 [Sulfitobacter sp. EhC04]
MFKHMKKLGLAAGVSLFALSSYAGAADLPPISAIDVGTTYAAATDTNAAEKFPEIATDLQAAIAERVPTSSDAADSRIKVDVRKVSLNGNMMLNDAGEFNELEGVVSIEADGTSTGSRSFPVSIAALAADTPVPEGTVLIQPSTDDFYNVMIGAFADRVAEELGNVNTGGDTVTR